MLAFTRGWFVGFLFTATLFDPVVLLEPWVMTPRVLTLTPDDPNVPFSGLGVTERGNCEVYELEDIETQIRH